MNDDRGVRLTAIAAHVGAFEPDFVKVLVRYHPNVDRAMNARQAARLARLSEWLAPRATKFRTPKRCKVVKKRITCRRA